MKTLHLNLHKKWFDMILSGEKKEEYRDSTNYWKKRIYDKIHEFNTITFSNGYAKNRAQFVIELKGLKLATGKKEWGAEKGTVYIVMILGEILSQKSL
jgi:RPA family protein